MMKSKRRVYKVLGTRWVQIELTGETAGPVRKLFRGFYDKEKTLGENIDAVFEKGLDTQLIGLVTKPYDRWPWYRILNRIRMKKRNITPEHVAEKMSLSQRAEVLADFFLLNMSGIGFLFL